MPVIWCRFPMSRKAASFVVSSGSTTTRPPGSPVRNSGSRVDRCAVSTTDSPRSSRARAVCDPIEPRPPVMRIIQIAPPSGSSMVPLTSRSGAAAIAEEHGNLVQDHLVEQSGAQRGSDDTAAHDRDIPIASSGASGLDAGFDGSDEGLLVRRLGWRRAVADHDERSRRVRARPARSSKTERLGSNNRKPGNSRLGVSPSPYQPKRMPPSPSPCPGPGPRPVMKPSTETDSKVKTLSMATDARAARAGAA